MKRFPWLVSRCLFGLAGAFGVQATMAVDFPSPVDGVVTVTMTGTYSGAGNVRDGGLSVTDGGTLRVSCEELFADGATPLTIDRGLTLGANVKVVVTDSDRLTAYETRRRATFVTAETLVGRPVSVVAADGVTPIANWNVSTKGKGLALGSPKGLYILFR